MLPHLGKQLIWGCCLQVYINDRERLSIPLRLFHDAPLTGHRFVHKLEQSLWIPSSTVFGVTMTLTQQAVPKEPLSVTCALDGIHYEGIT